MATLHVGLFWSNIINCSSLLRIWLPCTQNLQQLLQNIFEYFIFFFSSFVIDITIGIPQTLLLFGYKTKWQANPIHANTVLWKFSHGSEQVQMKLSCCLFAFFCLFSFQL